jgi:hypothetical protein
MATAKQKIEKLNKSLPTKSGNYIQSVNKGVNTLYAIVSNLNGGGHVIHTPFMPYKEMEAYIKGYTHALLYPLKEKE